MSWREGWNALWFLRTRFVVVTTRIMSRCCRFLRQSVCSSDSSSVELSFDANARRNQGTPSLCTLCTALLALEEDHTCHPQDLHRGSAHLPTSIPTSSRVHFNVSDF